MSSVRLLSLLFVLACLCAQLHAQNREPDQAALVRKTPQIRIYDGETLTVMTTGFVFNDDGKILTSYRAAAAAVENGMAMRGSFVGDAAAEFELGIWAAWPDMDLAVLYATDPAVKLGDKRLAIAARAPTADQPIWSVGYGGDKRLKAKIARGTVTGVRSVADFEALTRPQPELSRSSSWLQSSGATTFRCTGSPVVNAQGEVVGVVATANASAETPNFALDLIAIQDRLLRLPNRPAAVPKGTVMDARLRDRREGWGGVGHKRKFVMPDLPLKAWVVKPDVTPLVLGNNARFFAEGIEKPCPVCDGTGKVEVKIANTRRMGGPALVRPGSRTEERDCSRCTRGTVSAAPEALKRLGDNAVLSLGKLVAETPANETDRTAALDKLVSAIQFDREHGSAYANETIRKLQKDKITVDAPVVGYGWLLGSNFENGKRQFAVWIPQTDLLMLIDQPVDQDRAKDDQTVLFCGTVTQAADYEGFRMLVVQGGLVRKARF